MYLNIKTKSNNCHYNSLMYGIITINTKLGAKLILNNKINTFVIKSSYNLQ